MLIWDLNICLEIVGTSVIKYKIMKPFKYTKLKNGKTKYHYTFAQLREFLTHGLKEGDNGWIIVSNSEEFTDYRGFGTIENPL